MNNPWGIAVQPQTGEIFVAESGAGKVIRVTAGKAADVITGFPLGALGQPTQIRVGPLGLAFRGEKILLVGGGGLPHGEELIYAFHVPPREAGSILATETTAALGPLAPQRDLAGAGDFYSVITTPTAVFATCVGEMSSGWLGKANLTASGFSKFTRFVATNDAVGNSNPVALTVGPRGDLLVAHVGELDASTNSSLSFFNARTGSLRMNLNVRLLDICGLAYSTSHPDRLYATDMAWMDIPKGGLFRLDAALQQGKQVVKAVRLATLDRPASLAFAPDGSLYVTLLGGDGNGASSAGRLVKFPPGL